MTFKKENYTTTVQKAKVVVPGFKQAFSRFEERMALDQCSKSMANNYGRNIAHMALHFGKLPHEIPIEQVNSYLYRLTVHDNLSISFFKQTVFGLRYWYRLFGLNDRALQMPSIKHTQTLPTVLSKQECKDIFAAPRLLKHRFLLAFAYAAGLRMNELRHLKITDVDQQRKQIHIRQAKGRKDRYVILADLLVDKFQKYISEVKPQTYLFEGQTPGLVLGERSIQYIINEAVSKTDITKNVSMHTLRHSFATHLLEDGLDIHSIQRLLGHSDIRTTIVYLHIAQVTPKSAHSPLDSLYHYHGHP